MMRANAWFLRRKAGTRRGGTRRAWRRPVRMARLGWVTARPTFASDWAVPRRGTRSMGTTSSGISAGEPEAGEDLAAVNAVRPRRKRFEAPFAQDEPVNGVLQDPPDDVFPDPVPAVRIHLVEQVVAYARRRNLDDQLGRAVYITVA